MKKAAKYLLFSILLCVFTCATGSSRHYKSQTISTKIDFRFDSAALDTTYMSNGTAIKTLRQIAKEFSEGGDVEIVVISSHSSPDGDHNYNYRLAARRAECVHRFLLHSFPTDISHIVTNNNGEAWGDFREAALADNHLNKQAKEQIVSIIDSKGISVCRRDQLLSDLPSYGYIYRNIFPTLRHTKVEITLRKRIPFEYQVLPSINPRFTLPQISLPIEAPRFGLRRGYTPQPSVTKQVTKQSEEITPQQQQDPVTDRVEVITSHKVQTTISKQQPRVAQLDTLTFALKTNMLYDLATVLNAEVEVPIGSHLSAAAEVNTPWWESNNKFCVQLLSIGAEGRYWFSKNEFHKEKLRGHFVGVYGMSGIYDMQLNRKLCYQGRGWSVGATYGYVLPISRRYPINLEMSISVGYLSTAYQHYFPAPDYSELWIDPEGKGRLNYFGPTKLKVSLQIPINIPYQKRGGSR